MKRRVFVAIPIPDTVSKEIVFWQRRHANLKVRWIKPENLHITVVPPWYVTEEDLYEITKALKEAAQDLPPFEVRFEKVLFGPPGQTARLIWAEGYTPQELGELKERLESMFLQNPKTGFRKKEMRPAKLHLTIARFRPGTIKKLLPLDGGINWEFEVGEVDLMESKLKRTGAEYTSLRIFNFQ